MSAVTWMMRGGDAVCERSGVVLWRGRPLDRDVERVLVVPESNDAVVLLERAVAAADRLGHARREPAKDANLVRLGPQGQMLWQAMLPSPRVLGIVHEERFGGASLTDGQDCWVSVEWRRGRLTAFSWSCFDCDLDVDTGEIQRAVFTK